MPEKNPDRERKRFNTKKNTHQQHLESMSKLNECKRMIVLYSMAISVIFSEYDENQKYTSYNMYYKRSQRQCN